MHRQKPVSGELSVILAITAIIGLSFWPYIYFDFGFHNDFAIWEYDNSRCCNYVEGPVLIKMGRFLQSYLQNIYLLYFDSVPSFGDGRLLALVTNVVCAYLLYRIGAKNGLSRAASFAFALGVFLLPVSQINNSWVANYVPGVFNALLVISTTLLVPTCLEVRTGQKTYIGKLVFSVFLLLCALYIYPPTAGFFLLPVVMRLFFKNKFGTSDLKESVYVISIYVTTCISYFVLHKLYTFYHSIRLPDGSLYDFNVSTSLWSNFSKFGLEILPAFLNLFIGTSNWWVAGCVLGFIFWSGWKRPIEFSIFNKVITDKRLALGLSFGIFLVAFGLMNAPGLLAAGSPPTFFRAWHPGMAAVLLVFMAGIARIRSVILTRTLFATAILTGIICSLLSSLYLARTLSDQYESAKRQIEAQFDPERSTYLIVEKRPSAKFLGIKRWGELGFIHILSRGHAIHILASEHQHRVHPDKVGKLNRETMVSDENNIKLLLETELSGLKLSKMQMPIVVPNNKKSWTAIDNNVRSSFTIKHPNANLELEAAESERLACYNVVLPWPRSKNKILDGWKLYGASPNERWTLIDKQDFSRDPKEKTEKYFQVAKGTKQFKRYKFEFVPARKIPKFSIAEIELYTAGAKCQGAETGVSESDRARLTRVTKVISTKYNSEIVGFVSEASISNTPFRLQRAFDNIFYTFWETALTDPVEVFLRPETLTPVHCYAFKSGADQAHHRMPKDWSIWGRNIGDQWSLIERRTDSASWQDKEVRTYKTAKQGMFEEYRIRFTKTHGGQYLRLYEIKFSFDKLCSSYVP